jgi:hypothetical protein
VKPTSVPPPQEYLNVGGEIEVFHIASNSLPLNGLLRKTVFNITSITKVHPVNKEMKRGRIGNREKEDGMIG